MEWEQYRMISISTAPCVCLHTAGRHSRRWEPINSLLHSLRHLPLILSGPGVFFGLIFAIYFLTSSNYSLIGCLFRIYNSSARSWAKSVVSNRAKNIFLSFATWFSFSTHIHFFSSL